MKKKKMIKALSLLAFGATLLSSSFVNAAERMSAEEAAESSYVPSLQTLALNYIGKKKIEGNEKLFGKFKELVENTTFKARACEADVTREVAKIAALEYAKPSHKRVSPLDQYKKANPALGLLIDRGRIEYSLSIKDLMNAGAIIVTQNEFGDQILTLSNLALTSLDGLQEIANLSLLRVLSLSNNQLKELTSGALANLPLLQYLYLYSNQLKELTLGTLANLPLLIWLNLNKNQLTLEVQKALRISLKASKIQYLNLDNQRVSEIEEIVDAQIEEVQ